MKSRKSEKLLAQELVSTINAYWKKRGVNAGARIVERVYINPINGTRHKEYDVRSNLKVTWRKGINGSS